MTRDLLIVLRTCTGVQTASKTTRYIDLPKREIVRTCVSSLVTSINNVQGHRVRLVVLDDHSSPEAVSDIKQIISHCKFPTEFISVEGGTGNGYTMGRVYEQVEKNATDLWYHVEDDYFHIPEAVGDMIATLDQFETQTKKKVAINPHDDIWRYTRQLYPSYLLLGPHRHYRTVRHTTYTCLASVEIYHKYRMYFQKLVEMTVDNQPWVEDSSINKVWEQDDVLLFSPIPGLGFHIMDASGRDPYVDIEAAWDATPKLWTDTTNQKFAVVSMYNDAHKDLGEVTWPNKLSYAGKHGYLAVCKTSDWTIKPIHFEKIKLMLETLENNPDVDWAWWLDNDAVITNSDIRLESIADRDYHVIISPDVASLNAGSFMVRNSLEGKGWLEFILSKGLEHYRDNRWPEQQPMTDFYITFKDIIKVVPQKTLNSYDYRIYRVDPTDQLGHSGQWTPGDFVLHLPAIPNDARKQIIKSLNL